MGESNRARWLVIAESAWGTLPGTPTMEEILRTGGSLNGDRNTIVSNAVRTTRMRNKVYSSGKTGKGSLEFELSSGLLDTLLPGVCCSAWSSAITGAVSVTFDTTADTIHRAAGSFVSDGWVAGMHIYVSGAADSGNNGYARVTAVTATDLSVDKNLTTQAVAASCVLRNDGYIRNGTTAKSFSLEQGHLDQGHYYLWTGMRVGGFKLALQANGLATGSMDLMGLYPTYSSSTNASSVTAAVTTDAYNTASEIAAFFEGGATCAEDLTGFEIDLNNNLRNRPKLMSEAPAGIAYGVQDVTGTLSYYMGSSHTLANKVINFTESSAYVRFTNGSTDKTFIVTLPQYKYTGGVPPEAGGLDGDVTMKLPFRAYQGSGTYQIQFDRITP